MKLFVVKDRVDGGEIKVMDCPMEEMWTDVMSDQTIVRTAFGVM